MIISILGTIPQKLQQRKSAVPNVFTWKKTLETARTKNNEPSLVLGSDNDVEYEIENEAPFELVDSINSGKPV